MSRQRILVDDDVALNVVRSGTRAGPTIVFSNSLAADISMWSEVVALLEPQFDLVCYDTRGHGASELPLDGWSLERLGLDVLAIMDGLTLERAHFCGLSLGGITGQWLAAHHGARFHSLTVANTAANFPPASMWMDRAAHVTRSGIAELVSPTMERWLTPAYQCRQRARSREIAAMIAATPALGYAGGCNVLAHADVFPDLPRIEVPTLIIAGTSDPSTPPARAEEICAQVSQSRLVHLEAAHLSAVEVPEAFAAALRQHVLGV